MKTGIGIALIVMAVPQPAAAVVLRYAIVAASNSGLDADGSEPFQPLAHAEREARVLRDRLVGLANFDASASRTVLLTGATRSEVREAARRIARQRAEDEKTYGQVDSLFAFFFTGHGLRGRLLLKDGPLSADDLRAVFLDVGATFRVGVFDACYSGSLDEAALAAKGIELTPGVSPFRELPEELLLAEGSVWIVSSGSGDVSYEDRELGGVFTHFFIEALAKAPMDGVGITLESIWNYVRRQTVAYTSSHNRRQVPEQLVSRLKSSGPLYFSFPVVRSARLVLAEGVEGKVVLVYADGQLVESIDKPRGARQQLAVFSGPAAIRIIRADGVVSEEAVRFEPNAVVVLKGEHDAGLRAPLGARSTELWTKGVDGGRLTAAALAPEVSVSLGAQARGARVGEGVLAPAGSLSASLRLDRSALFAALTFGYGAGAKDYDVWSYRLRAAETVFKAGLATALGPTRVSAGAGLGATYLAQSFAGGGHRRRWSAGPVFGLGLLWPSEARISAELTLDGGPCWAPGVGRRSGSTWTLAASAALAVRVRL